MTVPELKLVLRDARIKPAVNEMELHPHFQQPELFGFVVDNKIQPVGYCPLGSPGRPERDRTPGDTSPMEDPVVVAIARRHGVHPAAVCIKWAVQRGQTPIPFSVNPRNYAANLSAVAGDPLSDDEMSAIAGVDRNCRLIKGQVFLWKDGQPGRTCGTSAARSPRPEPHAMGPRRQELTIEARLRPEGGAGRRIDEQDPKPTQEADMKITDKVAIITGAARGIGKAIAERYVKEGAKVVIADLNEEGAKTLASELGPNALGVKLDITQQESIDATVAVTVAHFGRLDILVNNAGIFDLAPIVEITRESYRRVFAVNVEGLLFMLQAGAKEMIKQGHGGKIINLASQAGRRGEALVAIYCSSKAAVISLTQSAGLDLIKYHINVNAIAPGVVANEHWEHVDEMFAKYERLPLGEKKRVVGASVPFGRMARPDELAGMATFLASEDADYIVAQTYNVDGGNWMS